MDITLAKGGTLEKTIPVTDIEIPDVWHIAHQIEDLDDRQAVLTLWHAAHDMKKLLCQL